MIRTATTALLVLLTTCLLGAAEQVGEALPADVPPSPSTAPGKRIWPDPVFTHWPAIAYDDETRNLAFSLPVRVTGVTGSIGWTGDTPYPFTLPQTGDSISGLLPLPTSVGRHVAEVVIGTEHSHIAMIIADGREAWPLVEVKNGFPIDGTGLPVVLLDHRRDLKAEHVWEVLTGSAERPTGRAWLVGDPMEALGTTLWDGLDAEAHPALDERFPQHAVLVALAGLPVTGSDLPRTIVWCPGNQVLFGGAWSPEEGRLLGLLRTRCEHLGVKPNLVLALPPLPVDDQLLDQARTRREQLLREASLLGWNIVDLARSAGDPQTANRVSDGLFTRYPLKDAQERMRQALRDELAR